jgi:hypothetical protein
MDMVTDKSLRLRYQFKAPDTSRNHAIPQSIAVTAES